jgi:hypothetical protein
LVNSGAGECRVKIDKPSGKFTPPVHRYLLRVHLKARPKQVLENGKLMEESGVAGKGWYFDSKDNSLYVQVANDNTKPTDISVRL